MENIKKQITSLKKEYINIKKLCSEEKKKLKESKDILNNIIEAQRIAQEAAEQIQQQIHQRITFIVNKCLKVIFPDPYEFQIRFTLKRGKTEADLVFMRNGQERKNVGGGVIDIVAFALRLSSLLLSNDKVASVEILDQPFGNISKAEGYLERVPDMLILLSEEFDIQFIQVTHVDELKIGKIIEIEK